MEAFGAFAILPTGPRDGGQGRRQVSPVWWSSDESSYAVSGLDERPDDDTFDRDETLDWVLLQEQSVQTRAPNPSTSHTAKAEHHPMSFSNRLRRQPAAVCLSAKYLESDGCSTHESREAGAVQQQTIPPTVATQGIIERTNHGARHSCQLSADTNQPGLVKISSGTRRASAQTFAAMLEAGVWQDKDNSAGQHVAHKDSDGAGTSTEDDACTRSSIASAEATSEVFTGSVAAKVAPAQHSEAPKLSPQHAEFLNVHSNGERYGSRLSPGRRDFSTPYHRIDEQNNLDRLKSIMAKYDGKVKAHVKARQRPRRQAMMRPEIASRQAPIDDDARIAMMSKSRQWREPRSPKEVPYYANTTLLRAEDNPAYLFLRGHVNNRDRLFEYPPYPTLGGPETRPSRGTLELGQARAIRISKPGKANVIKVSPHQSRSFDLGSLDIVETDLMFSAGTMAKSARRTSVRTEGTHLHDARSPATDGAPKLGFPVRSRQRSRIPRAVPGTAEHTARPYKQQIGGSSIDVDRDVRFPELVQRLRTNEPVSDEDAGHASVQESSQLVPSAAPASQQRFAVHPPFDRWSTGRIQYSILKHKAGHLSLQNSPRQSRVANQDDSALASPSKIPANAKPPPGNSGCPSLISDDGQEPLDFPEMVADEHARPPVFQKQPGASAWEKEEDRKAALDETSPEGSPTLVHLGMDDSDLFSAADTEAIHDENIRADEIHAGVGTSTDSERGWLALWPEPFSPPLSTRHGRHNSSFRGQHRHGGRMTEGRPDTLSLYGCCAILRWLISTNDAPGTLGMRHESSVGLELLVNTGEYRLLIDDDERANIQRLLNCLNEGIPLPPEPSDEVPAFLRSMNPPPIP